jgi:hypothetical protein
MNNINSTWDNGLGTCTLPVPDTAGVTFFAIDRKRNMLYYISKLTSLYYQLRQYNLSTAQNDLLYTGNSSQQLRRVCVDEDTGYLYAGYYFSVGMTSYYVTSRFDTAPAIRNFIGSTYITTGNAPFDMIIKDGSLYLSYAGTYRIEQVSLSSMTLVGSLGGASGAPFLGPHTFLAVPNRKLFFIDENEDDTINTNERVVSTYGISPIGIDNTSLNTFMFYSSC